MWFIGVEVEQEAGAPLLTKILDPPLESSNKLFTINRDLNTFCFSYIAEYRP